MLIATAGHVDHGKTVLVRALTGVDTDRLPEEKARGLSIDLGFAYHTRADGAVLGFVDVPGHERFIRNMLAGVAAIDHALLIVAADDGPMPQTREHLAILDLLGVDAGTVVVTKADLVDDARVAAVAGQVASPGRGHRSRGCAGPPGLGADRGRHAGASRPPRRARRAYRARTARTPGGASASPSTAPSRFAGQVSSSPGRSSRARSRSGTASCSPRAGSGSGSAAFMPRAGRRNSGTARRALRAQPRRHRSRPHRDPARRLADRRAGPRSRRTASMPSSGSLRARSARSPTGPRSTFTPGRRPAPGGSRRSRGGRSPRGRGGSCRSSSNSPSSECAEIASSSATSPRGERSRAGRSSIQPGRSGAGPAPSALAAIRAMAEPRPADRPRVAARRERQRGRPRPLRERLEPAPGGSGSSSTSKPESRRSRSRAAADGRLRARRLERALREGLLAAVAPGAGRSSGAGRRRSVRRSRAARADRAKSPRRRSAAW